jgi:DNA-binding transcriptional MerR regulator
MRIGDLARRSGIALTTIKYYLRVGLLPAGRATAHNQAAYDESQLRRLRLVTVLMGFGGMTVADTRTVLAAVDDADVPIRDLLAAIDRAGGQPNPRGIDEPARRASRNTVTALVRQRDWLPRPGTGSHERLVDTCAMARTLGVDLCAVLDDYAGAAMRLAECDLAVVRLLVDRRPGTRDADDEAVVREGVVVVAVLSGALRAVLCDAARRHLLPDVPDGA